MPLEHPDEAGRGSDARKHLEAGYKYVSAHNILMIGEITGVEQSRRIFSIREDAQKGKSQNQQAKPALKNR